MKHLKEYHKLFEGGARRTTEQYIDDVRKVHGDKYDYSLVDYKGGHTKIKIICPIHGEFEQLAGNHLKGQGCPSCGGSKKSTSEQFIRDAKKIHGDRYDYSLVDYKNAHTKVNIICAKHGIFQQKPNSHLSGVGCTGCFGTKKRSNDEFIEEARETHGDKYDYSLVDYKNNHKPIIIICPIHGEFKQAPINHINGQGCPHCYGNVKKTTEQFIDESRKVHGDKYDYSLVDYINGNTKVIIICPKHGKFEQTPHNHILGQGCPTCIGRNRTTEEFIKDAREIHGDKYDYSLVNYKGHNEKIKIICPIHGMFEQNPGSHLYGIGCFQCGVDKIKLKQTKPQKQFIEESNKTHGNKYDYSLVDYKNTNTKIKIICPKHGVFEQTPHIHIKGAGCPTCTESWGERIIRVYLLMNNIDFIPQKTFTDLITKNKGRLRYDFYLPKYNTCIEFDGCQHYQPYELWGGEKSFELQKIKDKIKTDYCNNNNIKLIRIPYWRIKNIRVILDKELGL